MLKTISLVDVRLQADEVAVEFGLWPTRYPSLRRQDWCFAVFKVQPDAHNEKHFALAIFEKEEYYLMAKDASFDYRNMRLVTIDAYELRSNAPDQLLFQLEDGTSCIVITSQAHDIFSSLQVRSELRTDFV
jgi:hypothetical protein